VRWLLPLPLVLFAAGCSGPPRECVALSEAQSLPGRATQKTPSCYRVQLEPGTAAQIEVTQPEDLQLRIRKTGTVVDAFEIEVETLTLHEAGEIDFEVFPVAASTVAFRVTRKRIPPESAGRWQEAEHQTTVARQSHQVEQLQAARRVWDEMGVQRSAGLVSLQIGDEFLIGGHSAEARDAYQRAAESCAGHLRCKAEAENNLGVAARRLGDVKLAADSLERAAADWKQLDLPDAAAKTLSNEGLLFFQLGDQQRAIVAFSQALDILDKSPDRQAYARVINNLGLCYLRDFDFAKALLYFESAAKTFEQGGTNADQTSAQVNLGRTYLLSGDPHRASTIFSEAVRKSDPKTNPQIRGDALNNLAQALLGLGNIDAAETSLRQARTLYTGARDKRGESTVYHYLSMVARSRGNLDLARKSASDAVSIQHDYFLQDEEAASLYTLAEVESAAGKLTEARGRLEQAIDLVESMRARVPGPGLRASYNARYQKYFELLIRLVLAEGGPNRDAESFLVADRARNRALRDVLAARSVEGRGAPSQESSDALDQLLRRRGPLLDELSFVALRIANASSADALALRQRANLLAARGEELDARISAAATSHGFGRDIKGMQELYRHIPEDSCILEYHLGQVRSYLWFVRGSGVQLFELDRSGDIESAAKRTIDLFGDLEGRQRSSKRQQDFERELARLSDLVLGKLNPAELPTRVILALDGILHRVPFAALQLPLGAGQLGLVRELVQTPSAYLLIGGKSALPVTKFKETILAVDDPVFDPNDTRVPRGRRRQLTPPAPFDGLPQLPFWDHLDVIQNLAPPPKSKILRDFDASRNDLEREDLTSYGIIEFFSHVYADETMPELSGIVLSMVDRLGQPIDGVLHPYQLSRLRLNRNVVILAGCTTGLGKTVAGEGTVGLANGLLYAGSSSVVVTLSKADAPVTSMYLKDVYTQILGSKPVRLEEAMKVARDKLKDSNWADPYYWATFTVIGMPSP
jgi:CHAT domain-containing protein/tetratricopeptide (TPR) repeat protein